MRDTVDMFKQPERGRFGEDEQHRPGRGPKIDKSEDKDAVELTLRLMEDRPLSIAVVPHDKFGKSRWAFLPKSQIEFELLNATTVTVRMPTWLARDKELL